MELSIIIVNYRSAALITDCINSILAGMPGIGFEIIVVDNNSGDDSEGILKEKFPFVRYIQMGYNAGFARANNCGIKASIGKAILLLNPDTLDLDNGIEKAYVKLMDSSHVACGAQLVFPDGSDQISGSFFMKGGLNLLLALPYWGRFLRWLAFKIKVKKPHVLSAGREVPVDWISGAFLMVKRSAVEKAGMLDDDFFLYGEEVEWCSRLGNQGTLALFGDCRIVHIMGEAIADATGTEDKSYANLFDRKGLQLMVSNTLFVRKKFGIPWMLLHVINYLWTIPVFLFLGGIKWLFSDKSNPFIKRFNGFSSNVFKLVGLVPTMAKGKPHFYKML